MKKTNLFYPIILSILIITSLIFNSKLIYIAPNLKVYLSIFIYPIVFIITSLIYINNNSAIAKKTVNTVIISTIIFFIIVTILCNINGTLESKVLTESLRNIFTPNNTIIKDQFIFYPDLIKLFTMLITFYLSSHIFIVIYDVCTDISSDSISFIIASLISIIIDQMLYFSIINIYPLALHEITKIDFIKNLTANFVITVLYILIMSIIYPIIIKIKKKN